MNQINVAAITQITIQTKSDTRMKNLLKHIFIQKSISIAFDHRPPYNETNCQFGCTARRSSSTVPGPIAPRMPSNPLSKKRVRVQMK